MYRDINASEMPIFTNKKELIKKITIFYMLAKVRWNALDSVVSDSKLFLISQIKLIEILIEISETPT